MSDTDRTKIKIARPPPAAFLATMFASTTRLAVRRAAQQHLSRQGFAFSAARSFSSLKGSYEYVLVDKKFESGETAGVGLITLNRPKALNALCDALFEVSASAVTNCLS